MAKQENLDGGTLEILTPQEVKERFDRNEIVLIDVRTPNEYAFEQIRGALLFPLSSFDPARLPAQEGKPIRLSLWFGHPVRTGRQEMHRLGAKQSCPYGGRFRRLEGCWPSLRRH